MVRPLGSAAAAARRGRSRGRCGAAAVAAVLAGRSRAGPLGSGPRRLVRVRSASWAACQPTRRGRRRGSRRPAGGSAARCARRSGCSPASRPGSSSRVRRDLAGATAGRRCPTAWPGSAVPACPRSRRHGAGRVPGRRRRVRCGVDVPAIGCAARRGRRGGLREAARLARGVRWVSAIPPLTGAGRCGPASGSRPAGALRPRVPASGRAATGLAPAPARRRPRARLPGGPGASAAGWTRRSTSLRSAASGSLPTARCGVVPEPCGSGATASAGPASTAAGPPFLLRVRRRRRCGIGSGDCRARAPVHPRTAPEPPAPRLGRGPSCADWLDRGARRPRTRRQGRADSRPRPSPRASDDSRCRPVFAPTLGLVRDARVGRRLGIRTASAARKRRSPLEPELRGDLVNEKSRRRPTLPGGLPPSTIGAGGLNCRVRNGNGCFPAAMATGNCALGGRSRPQRAGATPGCVSAAPERSKASTSRVVSKPSAD